MNSQETFPEFSERSTVRVLELFCGIGGCAAALPSAATVVAALDIHARSVQIYRENFPHPAAVRTLESLPLAELQAFAADLWWLSPPCQPYTVRGRQQDAADPRAAALLSLLPKIAAVRPPALALENVPGFADSECRRRLLATLTAADYHVQETILCPTEFGIPNRRRRYYLVASQSPPRAWSPPKRIGKPLANYLDAAEPAGCEVAPQTLAAYAAAIDVVDADDPAAVTACFTAAYGKSPIRSGSYLRLGERVRRFSPREILRLMGFPDGYRLPELPPRKLWPLVGDTLAVDVVRHVLTAVAPLPNGTGSGKG